MPNSEKITTESGESLSISNAKALLRKEMLSIRKNIPPATRARADEAICRHLLKLLEEYPLLPLTAYITDGTEPDLRRVLEFPASAVVWGGVPFFVFQNHASKQGGVPYLGSACDGGADRGDGYSVDALLAGTVQYGHLFPVGYRLLYGGGLLVRLLRQTSQTLAQQRLGGAVGDDGGVLVAAVCRHRGRLLPRQDHGIRPPVASDIKKE